GRRSLVVADPQDEQGDHDRAAADAEQPAEEPRRGPDREELEPAGARHAGHTRGVSVHAQATELLSPLIADPSHSAVMLDVDGTLAPIVRHADDAMMAQPTRSLLSAIAKRYALVACISGRRATDTRRIRRPRAGSRTGDARGSRSARRCGSTRASASATCCATPTSPTRCTPATMPPTSTRFALWPS